MKCFEIRQCSGEERSDCYVWNSFRENPEEMEDVKCWVLKNVYHPENRDLLKRCLKCKYYIMMNRDTEPVMDLSPDIALIRCEGVINYERTRGITEVWDKLKKSGKSKVVLDLTNVNNIYSCGLGVIVKIHKETQEVGGMLVVAGAQAYVKASLDSTKLSRLLSMAPDARTAAELFEARARKTEVEEEKKKKEAAAKPRKRIPCWEYFENHNPRNATTCDECFRKISPANEPCWTVDGMIEGVAFQYVNEECEECAYFIEFGAK